MGCSLWYCVFLSLFIFQKIFEKTSLNFFFYHYLTFFCRMDQQLADYMGEEQIENQQVVNDGGDQVVVQGDQDAMGNVSEL